MKHRKLLLALALAGFACLSGGQNEPAECGHECKCVDMVQKQQKEAQEECKRKGTAAKDCDVPGHCDLIGKAETKCTTFCRKDRCHCADESCKEDGDGDPIGIE